MSVLPPSLSGVVEILAHKISLIRFENGEQRIRDIEELFLSIHAIQSITTQQVNIGGGLSYTEYVWPNPSDSVIPGLQSLLTYLQNTYRRNDDDSIINRYYTIHKRIRNQFLQDNTQFTKQIRNTNIVNNYQAIYETQRRIKKLAIENHEAVFNVKKTNNTTNKIKKHYVLDASFSLVKKDHSTKNITQNITQIQQNKRSFRLEDHVSLTQVKRVTDQRSVTNVTNKRYDVVNRDDHFLTQVSRTQNISQKHTHVTNHKDDHHFYRKHVTNRYQTVKKLPVWIESPQFLTYSRTGLTTLTWAGIVGKPQLYTESEVDALLTLKVDSTTLTALLALKANQSDLNTTNATLALKANSADVYTTSQVYTKTESDSNFYSKSYIDTVFSWHTTSNYLYTRTQIDGFLAAKANQSDLTNLTNTVNGKADASTTYSIIQVDSMNNAQNASITANSQSIIGSQIDISMLQIADNGLQSQITNNYSTFTSTINALQTQLNWLTNEVSTLKNTLFNTQVQIGLNTFTPEKIVITGCSSTSFNNNTKVLTLAF